EPFQDSLVVKPPPPPPPNLPVKLVRTFTGQDRTCGAMAFSADGRYFASCGVGANFCCVWEVATGKLRSKIVQPGGYSTHQIRLSRDGELILVIGTGGNECRVFRTSDGSTVSQFKEHTQ